MTTDTETHYNILTVKDNENVTVIEGDILDEEYLRKSIKNVDIVIHTAVIAGVSSNNKMPLKTMEVNMIGTHTLLNIVKNVNIDLVIYSSTSIYGPHIFRVKENGETIQGDIRDARWTYLINKLASLPAQFLGMKDRGFLLE